MNYAIVFRLLSYILFCEAALLLLPATASLCYGEWSVLGVFVLTAALCLVLGLLLSVTTGLGSLSALAVLLYQLIRNRSDRDKLDQEVARSNFLMNAPAHIVGVVFGSRSGLHPTIHGHTDTGGTTNFFLKEQSPYWHESFLEPLRGSGGTA